MIRLFLSELESPKINSDAFVRYVLGKYLDLPGLKLNISKNEFGKPFLKDFPKTHYNISHTKQNIICAVSDRPIGVDIECTRKVNNKIVDRYYSFDEQNYVYSSKYNRDGRYTEIWTKKEAYVKWIGDGIEETSFKSIDVTNKNNIGTFEISDTYISICSNLLL